MVSLPMRFEQWRESMKGRYAWFAVYHHHKRNLLHACIGDNVSNTKCRSDVDILRFALTDVTGEAYDASTVGIEEMLLGLHVLVASGSRDELAKLAGTIATLLGQPPELCELPNIRFRKLSSPVFNIPSSSPR